MCFRHDIPDQQLERDFDISVDLTMTSVIYTHTKRFPIEIINFLQDVLEHHDSIGHMRAASQGQQVSVISTMVNTRPACRNFTCLECRAHYTRAKKADIKIFSYLQMCLISKDLRLMCFVNFWFVGVASSYALYPQLFSCAWLSFEPVPGFVSVFRFVYAGNVGCLPSIMCVFL